MNDPNRPPFDEGSEPVQFGEWLEMTAKSREVSKQEVLEQLISSYWTLNEMTEIIQQPEGEPADQTDDPFEHAVSGKAVPASRSEFENFASEVESQLADFDQRLIAIKADVEQEAQVSTEKIEQRLETEFNTLRQILERLIALTNENEEEIDELHRRIREDVAGIREEQSRLDHLQWRAMELGVSDAQCDNCDSEIDLSLLPSPNCPTCGQTFTDISPKRTILGIGIGSDVLETTNKDRGRKSERRARPDSRADQGVGREGDRADDRRIGGFEWKEERRRD